MALSRRPGLSPFLFPHASDPARQAVEQASPAPRCTVSLSRGELFVLASIRAFVAPILRPKADHPDWRELFALAEMSPVAEAEFARLMHLIGSWAVREIAIRCCHCPTVGADERLLLDLVAALQCENSEGGRAILSAILPPPVVPGAAYAAERFAAAAAAAGYRLRPSERAPRNHGGALPREPL